MSNIEKVIDNFRNNWAKSISMKPFPDGYDNKPIQSLVRETVKAVAWNGDAEMLILTEDKTLEFSVTGDCCSHSYFYDFIGIKNLLNNGKIIKAEAVLLNAEDAILFKQGILECQIHNDNPKLLRALKVQQTLIEMGKEKTKQDTSEESIQVYGYRLITVSPNWGEVSSVFSFRNSSNGYYGGSISSNLRPYGYFDEEVSSEFSRYTILLDDKLGD